jgi:hypothetical protein
MEKGFIISEPQVALIHSLSMGPGGWAAYILLMNTAPDVPHTLKNAKKVEEKKITGKGSTRKGT